MKSKNQEPGMYRMGTRFLIKQKDYLRTYEVMLVSVYFDTYVLIVLSEGNRWSEPVRIPTSQRCLTREQLLMLVNSPSTTIRKIRGQK